MVKNIVFDIGNVLFGFEPSKEIEKAGISLTKINYINNIIVHDDLWNDYLNGLVTLNNLENHFKESYREYSAEIDILLQKENQKYIIVELKRNTSILKVLIKKYNIYLLSNIAKETYEYLKETYELISDVRGGIFSYQEHISKPKKEIFLKLIKKYNLRQRESIYIDDKVRNIKVANDLGFIGIKCGLEDDLEKLLNEEGVFIEYTRDNS